MLRRTFRGPVAAVRRPGGDLRQQRPDRGGHAAPRRRAEGDAAQPRRHLRCRGMVMARRGLDSERAYRQLVSLARQARIPLTELAERMVASPVRRDPPADR
ncbi:ANTAR domain-containing protein [Mycolicibacterium sp. P1-18]|nr:ANTAR domain-containing protein [Mycolicibacterium sp. P1-18]